MAKETAIERASETGSNILERVVLEGNLAELTPAERVAYYMELCASLGLNVASRPFEYVTFQGKLVLYARKDATEQLRRIHKVSIVDVRSEHLGDLYVVTVKAQTPDGRTDVDQGILTVAGLRGEALSNALMKAITKAKRRVTLSLCGLALPDESELASIPNAHTIRVDEATGEILEPPAALPPQRTIMTATAPPATSAPICAAPGCGATLTQAQYNLSMGKFKRGLCLRHQKEQPVEAPAPVANPQSAEQQERWRRLVREAKDLGVNVEPFRPSADTAPDDVAALLTGLETLLAEVREGQPAEVAA